MSLVNTANSAPLGKGLVCGVGSIADTALASLVGGYKRTVASRYRVVVEDGLAQQIPPGKLLVSPKIDGQIWFLVMDGSEVVLVSPTGRAISGDVPVLKEARAMAARAQGRTVIAGELFALRKGGRPRVGDISRALGGGADAEVAKLGYAAFDLVTGGDAEMPAVSLDYSERLDTLRRLLEGGKRCKAIKTDVVSSPAEVQASFDALVKSGKAEGLIVRSADGRIFKVKPSMSLDAVVIGYTRRTEDPDQARSLLLALMREDGRFQQLGSVGNLSTDDYRKSLLEKLSALDCTSTWRHASSSGVLYCFVKPELVVQVRVSDLQSEDSSGGPIKRMVLDYADGKWSAVRKMQGASIIHPVFERIRDDKAVNSTDIRTAQIEERIFISDLHDKSEVLTLPASEVIRREVYTKTTKGKVAVRKLLVWKTGKDEVDPRYPAYVVHWTDYSPGRRDPIKRTVRPAPDEAEATALGDELITKNIKRGWTAI